MTRWKILIEYVGTGFSGWQRQENARSVQQTIEDAIFRFSGETVTTHVAGRTDAGVHALAQVAHFDLEKEMDAATIMGALNFHVRPHPVVILSVEKATPEFHARFDARGRQYRYLILNRSAPSALWRTRAWQIYAPLDTDAMNKAAQILLGKHDFSTFRASQCQAKSPLRTLEKLDVTRAGEIITFETSARSFLYHQVRNMVGTLVLVGKGQWSLDDLRTAFAAADRKKGGPTAPPDGLYFTGVTYENGQ